MTADRDPPRAHPMQFKYALVARALEQAEDFVALCDDGLPALWDAIGGALAETDRVTATGLAAHNAGDTHHPVVMVTLPRPERPNEAYYLCALPANAELDANGGVNLPDPDGPLKLRMFGMERSMLPDGGLIGFVVEWTALYRHNYDAPDNGSQAAFWKAILEIVGGTRKSVHTTNRQHG